MDLNASSYETLNGVERDRVISLSAAHTKLSLLTIYLAVSQTQLIYIYIYIYIYIIVAAVTAMKYSSWSLALESCKIGIAFRDSIPQCMELYIYTE